MWSANRKANRPYPYVRVVRLDETMKAVVDEPDIWSAGYAFAYPDAYPNEEGDVASPCFAAAGPATLDTSWASATTPPERGGFARRATVAMGQPTASGGTT
jgi:hypothetical protein